MVYCYTYHIETLTSWHLKCSGLGRDTLLGDAAEQRLSVPLRHLRADHHLLGLPAQEGATMTCLKLSYVATRLTGGQGESDIKYIQGMHSSFPSCA